MRLNLTCLCYFVTTLLAKQQSACAFQAAISTRRKASNKNAPTCRCSSLNAVKVNEQEDGPMKDSGINGIKPTTDGMLQKQSSQTETDAVDSKPLMNNENDMPIIEIDQQDKMVMLGLLWITACLSALDRVAMSVALVPMTAEFGLTDTIKGEISSFFSVGYGLGIIPAGIILSFASPRLVMSTAVVSWSLATLATPWAAESLAVSTTATTLLFIRACVGAAESLVMPTLQRLLLAWTTVEEKALGIATVVSGFQAGTIAAYLVSPILMDIFGDGDAWRQLFYVYGAFGLALVVPWLLFAKDGPDIDNAPLAIGKVDDNSFGLSSSTKLQEAMQVFKEAPWSDFIRSKGAWAMLLAHCSKNWYVILCSSPALAIVSVDFFSILIPSLFQGTLQHARLDAHLLRRTV